MLYRFMEITGHARAIDTLQRAVGRQRLHHATLLTGPEGVGKRRVAEATCALLNCATPAVGPDGRGDACGTCPSCRKLAASSHPDRLYISAQGSGIRIEQVREVTARTRFRPVEGKTRCVLIDDAHLLREEAANALLKTLEEPTGDTVFFLITAQPQRLLPTIRSRCQPLRLGVLSPEEVDGVLREAGVEEAAERNLLAHLALGSPGRALALRDAALLEARSAFAHLLCGDADAATLVREAEALARRKDELPELLQAGALLYRDAALQAAGAEAAQRMNPDLDDAVHALAQRHSALRLARDAGRFEEALHRLHGNVQPRMVMESLLLALRAPDAGAAHAGAGRRR